MKALTKSQIEVYNALTNGVNTLESIMVLTGKKWGPLVTSLRQLIEKGFVSQPNLYKNEYFKVK